jgi:hypothetical protein
MNLETKAMHDILNKLKQANPKLVEAKFNAAAEELVESSKTDINLRVAMTQQVSESNVTVQNYRIDIVLNEFAGREKKFYNIVETKTNKIIHRELSLFETAMGIVKKYITGSNGIEELEQYDTEYGNALYEVWTHHGRVKRGVNEDIAIAKADAAKQRVAEAKRKIMKRL